MENFLANWKQHRPTWSYELHDNYVVLTSVDKEHYNTLDFIERSGAYWLIPELKKTGKNMPIIVSSEQNIGVLFSSTYQKNVYLVKLKQACPEMKISQFGKILALGNVEPQKAQKILENILA